MHDDRNAGKARVRRHPFSQCEPVHFRHFHIGKDQLNLILGLLAFRSGLLGHGDQLLPGFSPGRALEIGQTQAFQGLYDLLARDQRVIGEQHPLAGRLYHHRHGTPHLIGLRTDVGHDLFYIENEDQPAVIKEGHGRH